MANKKENFDGSIENTTGTEIQILQSIERAFFKNNPESKKRNTEKSLKWFSKYVPRAYNRARTSQAIRGDASMIMDSIEVGSMYFFVYDAKHKKTLPVWDAFPLIFPWASWRGNNGVNYFAALNMHYLSPALRFKAMIALLRLRNQKRYRKSTRLEISWAVLKSLSESKYFEHCVKVYILDNVRSKFIKVPPAAWELALFLPVARWQKGDQSLAWSMRK